MEYTHFKKHKLLYIFIVIAVIIYIIYGLISKFYHEQIFIINFLQNIGNTFFLAALLTLTVEKINGDKSKELYEKEVSKLSLAFITLFAEKEGEELKLKDKNFTDILIGIAGQSYYRKNYQLTVENINEDGFINFWVEHETQNLQDMDFNKEYKLGYDTKTEEANFKCLKIINYDDNIIFNGDTENKIKKITSKNNHNNFIKHKYILPANKYIKFQYNLDFKLKITNDKILPLFSSKITKDITIKIKSDIVKNYNFSFSETNKLKFEKKHEQTGYHIYKYKGYLLPYQGFELRFNMKR